MGRKPKNKKTLYGTEMGFKQAFQYVLDVLCYAYYVKGNNFVDDICFDQLEKIWCVLFDEETAPCRSMEREECYSNGVRVIYDEIIKQKNKKE